MSLFVHPVHLGVPRKGTMLLTETSLPFRTLPKGGLQPR